MARENVVNHKRICLMMRDFGMCHLSGVLCGSVQWDAYFSHISILQYKDQIVV